MLAPTLGAVLGFVTAASSSGAHSGRGDIVSCLSSSNVPQSLPGTADFAEGIKPYNLRLPFTPAALAVPSTVAQVQAAVSCGRELGLKISPRSGGHSYASHGIGGEDGHLVIDMKLFNEVSVDTTTNIASIGSGARLGNVALALYEQGGRAFSHGVCPGVGIGGHVLHGGYGLASHTYGLALDFMLSATVVLADGSMVTASETQNSDLFWALRGAGCSFGIVTDLKFKTIAAPEENFLFYFIYLWNSTQAEAAFEAIQNYANSSSQPKEMNMRILIGTLYGATVWILEGVYHGSESAFSVGAQTILTQLGPTYLTINKTLGWIDSLYYANNNGLLPGGGSGELLETSLNYTAHSTFFAKSLMTDWTTPKAMQAFMSYLYTTGPTNPRPWYIIIALQGGPTSAITQVPKAATSFAHRSSLLTFELFDLVTNGTYPSSGFSFLDGFVDVITDAMKGTSAGEHIGTYYNYADPTLSTHHAHQGYWAEHYQRLTALKRRWDPQRIFMNPQAVLSDGD